ncbi:MAG: FecR domain-containing protein [Muribaculaceae bacterium]|nr:FecR domain-containing protein [Muribaculaceae bacterium]
MDKSRHNINTHLDSGMEREQDEMLYQAWQTFEHSGDERHEAELAGIKKRVDAFIDDYEQKRAHSVSRWLIWGKIAAVIMPLLMIGMAAVVVMSLHGSNDEVQPLCVVTAAKERATVILPDGTDVCLNSNTELKYAPGFMNDSIRSVSLVGEAFFNVAKDAERPFVISLDDVVVRVLGTSFNIKSLPDASSMQIALVEGEVKLISPGAQVILSPGNIASYNSSSRTFEIESRGCHQATGWLRHEKTYINVAADSLIKMIEHDYEVALSAEAKDSIDDAFTGTLPDDNLEETLSILSEIYDFDMKSATLKFKPQQKGR